jgi:GPH family glycoside/pentoside/hexuronide:cation symporter
MFKTKTKAPSTGLTMKHKIGYALGDAGGCMTFALMDGIFGMYCTDALGINPGLFATLLLVWNIWDFVNDPIMGILMDRVFAKTNNPKGKIRPWLLRSAPLICISFIALFTVPSFFKGMGLLAVLFACKLLYEAAYTMFNIPMGSLLSSMADNEYERTSLSSARGIGSGLGNALPLGLVPVIVKFYGANNTTGYAIGASICAVIGFVLCLGHYYLTEERVKNANDANSDAQVIKVKDIINIFKVNRPFLALCLHGFFFCMVQALGQVFNVYLYEHLYGGIDLSTLSMAVSMPVMFICYIVAPIIAKKTGIMKFIRYALVAGVAIHVLLFVAHIMTPVNVYVHMVISNLGLGLASMSVYMQWGFVGEAIDYNEMITGKRAEGSIYGIFNLFRRIGKTFSSSLGMFMLAWFGYNIDLDVQSDTTIFGIKLLAVLLPGIFIIGSWFAFKYVWNLDEETKAKITEFKTAQKEA